jgi:four helix bundle protein
LRRRIAFSAYYAFLKRSQKEDPMSQLLSFRDLEAWQASMDLVLATYALVRKLPAGEQFELARQMRRAAVSIPSNIAEGHAGGKAGRYLHHLLIAVGSLAELDTQIEVSVRLSLLSPDDIKETRVHLVRARQLLSGLTRSMRRKLATTALGIVGLIISLAAVVL